MAEFLVKNETTKDAVQKIPPKKVVASKLCNNNKKKLLPVLSKCVFICIFWNKLKNDVSIDIINNYKWIVLYFTIVLSFAVLNGIVVLSLHYSY